MIFFKQPFRLLFLLGAFLWGPFLLTSSAQSNWPYSIVSEWPENNWVQFLSLDEVSNQPAIAWMDFSRTLPYYGNDIETTVRYARFDGVQWNTYEVGTWEGQGGMLEMIGDSVSADIVFTISKSTTPGDYTKTYMASGNNNNWVIDTIYGTDNTDTYDGNGVDFSVYGGQRRVLMWLSDYSRNCHGFHVITASGAPGNPEPINQTGRSNDENCGWLGEGFGGTAWMIDRGTNSGQFFHFNSNGMNFAQQGGGSSWSTEVVDDFSSPDVLQSDADMATRLAGGVALGPNIVYQRQTGPDENGLVFATRVSGGIWSWTPIATVTGTNINYAPGVWADLERIGGVHMVAYNGDDLDDQLYFAREDTSWAPVNTGSYIHRYIDLEEINGVPCIAAATTSAVMFTCDNNYVAPSLNPVSLSSPTGRVETASTMDLSWQHQGLATGYNIQVFDPNNQPVLSQAVDAATCSATCTVSLPLGFALGDYDVWIDVTDGTTTLPANLSEFQAVPLSTTLSSPTGSFTPQANIDLTFTMPTAAYYMVADIYYPNGGYDRQVIDVTQCNNGVCTISVPSYGLWGEYSVWMVSGWGPYFGNWTNSTFRMESDSVTLTAPTGNIAYTDTLDLTFTMPADAYYAVVDIYYPNGGYDRQVIDVPSCSNGVCTASFPSYGLSGIYGVWAIPGWGSQFGSWAYSEFSMAPADLASDAIEVLGNASAPLPALDTSQVEAAVEGPGN